MDDWAERHGVQRAGGRPKKDVLEGWQKDYRQWIVKFKGNRVKAAEKTPYAWETIAKMLTPDTSEFDKVLAEQVTLAYQELAGQAEEATFDALQSLVENPTTDQAKISQAQAYISTKILEKIDSLRWGNKMSVNVKGKVQHQLLPSDTVIAQLAPAQQAFFGNRAGKALPAAPAELTDNADVLEAEVVE